MTDISKLPNWQFGDTPELAERLAALIVLGEKRATCGAKVHGDWAKPGDQGIVTLADETPVAVIEITATHHLKFEDVSEDLAIREGEGDLSFAYWHAAHVNFFTREGVYEKDMEVVFEEFKLVKVLDQTFAASANDHLFKERKLTAEMELTSLR